MLTITGKSLSEALIFPSTNQQYDNRLFIELQVQYMKIPSSELGENMLCTQIVFCFDIQNNFCTQHVLLILRASEKDIPVRVQVHEDLYVRHSQVHENIFNQNRRVTKIITLV